ncbi:unnamed protein product [Phytomonas sp. EM1]|nr:unnamed protein product [Phytomonas sp. EM1]|eukprot:CCW63953.1 unnamed protein product [Phytomonas sp. isolate EM1]
MWRFRYEELPDFDMYCIDAAGDHVDIDRRQDFEGLTAPYWARLNQMHQENQRNHAVENSNASEHSRPLNHTTHVRHPTGQGGGGGNREDSADDGRSTETVIRLYVRDSCSYRRTYPQPQESIGGVGSFTHPSRFSTDRGNMASDFAISAVEVRLASTEEMPKPTEPRRRSVSGPAAPHLRDRLHSREHAELGDLSHLHKAVSDAHAGLNDTLTCSPSSQKRRSLMEVLKRANAASPSNSFRRCVNNQLQWTRMAVLGKGSFGTVYEGITTDGKLMAVKVQELPMNDNADEIRAVQSEINLMCTMTHKNIVAYYGCQVNNLGNGSRQMEIFLELCHGGTLAQMRQRFERAKKPFSISLVRSYTRQILEGLCYLHSCNVMHRDIKCDNVLISATGEAKLSDFGCSKRIGAATIAVRTDFAKGGGGEGRGRNSGSFPSSASAAAHHSIVGSPLFMAPEVLQASGADGGVGGGSGGYSMAADIWSVGCVVLELLGREPWIVSGRNIFQLMFHISQSKGLPNGVPARCPAVLLDFFHMCFERDPTRRWTAAQLLKHPWMVCPESELEEVPADEAAGK